MLSKRAHNFDVDLDYLHTYSVYRALHDPYDAKTNPTGIINLGTAVSGLMDDVWLERFRQIDLYKPDTSHFRYYQFWGPDDFLQSIADFMNTFFKPSNGRSINKDNLIVLNGALLALDILSCLIGDEKDVILIPVPCYTSYFHACVQRWGIQIATVPMTVKPIGDEGVHFELTVEKLEEVLEMENAKGNTVRALIFNNPQNPLGKVFPPSLVIEIMEFCQRHGLHLIVDEMYCLSVFNGEADYQSVLSMPTDSLISSDLLHVIWGFSKDLCLTSYRTGVIHTRNEPLKLNLKVISQLQAVPLPMMRILQNIIKDTDWFKDNFFTRNHDKMREMYLFAKGMFNNASIKTTITSAGFFFLADFGPIIQPLNDENCHRFLKLLYDNKVYLTPSWEMKAPLGWFRVVFTVYSQKDFNMGFERILASVQQWNASKQESVSVSG